MCTSALRPGLAFVFFLSIDTFPRRVGWIRVLFGKATLFIKPWNLFFVQRAFFKGVCAEKLDLHGEWWWSNIPLIKDYSEILHQLKITGPELTRSIPLRLFSALLNVANNPTQLTKSSMGEVIPSNYIDIISSVRSSNSHPNLLLTHHHHPTFSYHTSPQHWTFTFWATRAK